MERGEIPDGEIQISLMKPCDDGSPTSEKQYPAQIEGLVAQIRDRARNLYESRQLLCTEAVVVALNQGLGGGLTQAQAIAVAAPFSEALGGSGCLCGALSGAVMASGLLLGKEHPYRFRKDIRSCACELHQAFRASHGAVCCRVLSNKFRQDKKAHFRQCAGLTAGAAELAARLILRKRPELAGSADEEFIKQHQSRLGGAFLRLVKYFRIGSLINEQ